MEEPEELITLRTRILSYNWTVHNFPVYWYSPTLDLPDPPRSSCYTGLRREKKEHEKSYLVVKNCRSVVFIMYPKVAEDIQFY